MKYHRTFLLLLASGHSGAKAAQIVLDASRGDQWALDWIRLARRLSGSGGLLRLMAQLDEPTPVTWPKVIWMPGEARL